MKQNLWKLALMIIVFGGIFYYYMSGQTLTFAPVFDSILYGVGAYAAYILLSFLEHGVAKVIFEGLDLYKKIVLYIAKYTLAGMISGLFFIHYLNISFKIALIAAITFVALIDNLFGVKG